MDKNVFVTKDGNRIPLRRVAPLLMEKVRQSVKLPTPPTYEVETVGGDIEIHVHDETTLETDEDRAAWAAYQTAQAQANGDLMEKILRLLFAKATGDVVPAGDEWIKEQQYLGVDVPDDPLGRKIHYIQTELLTHTGDIMAFMSAAVALTGVDEEVVESAEATFRNQVRQAGEDPGPDTPKPETEGALVAQPDIPGGGGSKGVGVTAQPVGRSRRR